MPQFPENLAKKIENRIVENSLRILKNNTVLIDFSSNDYLGIAQNKTVFDATHRFLETNGWTSNGSTGSRLISGNHPLYKIVEEALAKKFKMPAALVFNSGYSANVGFFSSVPQKGDIVLYDELCHASIREGLQLSNAKIYKYKHLNYHHLEEKLQLFSAEKTNIYVVTESVFSMDGDCADLKTITNLTEKYQAYLVVDEAHSVGILGEKGTSLVDFLDLQSFVFARIITFGKAYGCHGAAVLGSEQLNQYLTNFARSFIYTTALSPHSLATIYIVLQYLTTSDIEQKKLLENIRFFKKNIETYNFKTLFIDSNSPIQSCVLGGNENVKNVANYLENNGFDVKPILSPTVPEGTERLRFCIHSFTTEQEITAVFGLLNSLGLGNKFF